MDGYILETTELEKCQKHKIVADSHPVVAILHLYTEYIGNP